MSFQSLSSELTGVIPPLSVFLADSYITRAQRDIYDARTWSFLQSVGGSIICPTQVTDGLAAITQGALTVTMDSDASTALLTLDATSPLETLQIRFGGTNGTASVGQIYNIVSFDQTVPTAIVLTLDRVVAETTNASVGYQVYRCYVKPPVDDFLMFQTVNDMVNGWSLDLDYTSAYFDHIDPQRMSQGQAYKVGAYVGSPEDQTRPRYELWPHPTSGQTFFVRFRRQGQTFTQPTDTQPNLIPEQLILLRAQGWYAYPWAAANVGRYPTLRGVGWVAMTLDAKRMYVDSLQMAKKNDDNQQNSSIINRGHGLRRGISNFQDNLGFPIDAKFMQGHLLNF